MDIRSIIDPDASDTARATPALRQRSDAKVAYPQTQSNFQSPYEAQASAYKGPRETRPPQPPPLLPPTYQTHNDLRSPSASSHNSSRSPYQQTPSSAISGGQYPFPQHPVQSLPHGFQPSEYAQREGHMASTPPGYQPYGPPTSISQTPTVTTPISSHTYSSQTRHGSSRSLSTPTSAQSNMIKESPKGSFDPTFDPIKAAYESHPSHQYFSQLGTPLGPPSMTARTTSVLRRDSPSASYEHQRNHSSGSYGHQQMISSSPTTDRPGPSLVSPPTAGPRQSLSHVQNYHNKHEREKSLSVSPKTKLPSELNLRQSNEDSMLKSKDHANVGAHLNSAKVQINEDRLGVLSSQEQSAIQSPSRSRSYGMKVILNSPSLNEVTSIAKQSTVQTKKLPTKPSDNNELKSTLANPIHSDRSESQSKHNFAVDSKQINKKSPSHETSPSKWNSPPLSISSKTQIQTQARDHSKEQTSHDSFPLHMSSVLHTRNFSSVPLPVVNSSASQPSVIPQPQGSPLDEKLPSQRFSPKRNSPTVSVSSKAQTQIQTKESLNEPTSPDSFPPHLFPLLHTTNFSSAPLPVANSSSSQSRAAPPSPIHKPTPSVSIPRQPSPAQTSGYSQSPTVPNSTPTQVPAKTPFNEQSTQIIFSPHPSPLQAVEQSALPPAPTPSQPQNTPKPPLKEQSPPASILPHPATPLSATQSPLPTTSNPSTSQKASTPPLQPQSTMSPAPSSQTVVSSSSTTIAEAVEPQSATKKAPGSDEPLVSSSSDRRRKRRRFEEIPIFARSCLEPWPSGSQNPGPINKDRSPVRNRSPVRQAMHPRQSIQPTTKQVKQETNGHALLVNDVPLPNAHSMAPDSGLLGTWEASITDTIPSDEYIRQLSDFIYKEVVGRLDVDVGPAGGGSSAGAVIEIEAKIGQLIDKNTNSRLRLPVVTECVINKDDPGLRVNFKSSMTEAQHRAMNEFLNKAFMESQNPKGRSVPPHTKLRIPMSYVHTHECDTFYELSQAGILALPQSIFHTLNSRHSKAKVRITTDQKSGNTLAKIVKVRLADLDVYSPSTNFDYRISINLEKNLDDNWRDLVEPMARNVRKADRMKDRVSYKHLAYQIDLTQVVSPEASQKEHELEVEVSTAELRKHGILLRDGQPNEFSKLVEGFVNNIRILARRPS